MFKNIVSQLPFNPSMVHNLGFYAKRLRSEEMTRRIGLVLTAFALVVQSLVVLSPPEPANAASSNDMIYGGISSGSQLLSHYDANTNNIRDFYTAIGLTRAELAQATNNVQRLSSRSNYSWGMTPQFSAAQGEGAYTIQTASGGNRSFYYRPHRLWGDFTYRAFVGHSQRLGWFAIQFNCGNLITQTIPPAPQCPPGQIGTYPQCSTPPAPAAVCNGLEVKHNGSLHQFNASASVAHGASIQKYVFTIYRNHKPVKTLESTSPTVTYTDATPGSYRVALVVKTSLGDKTASACEKTFTIPEPERCPQNPKLLKGDPRCQPCPGDATLWIHDQKCSASFVQTKNALNLTRGNIDATRQAAQAGDKITYKQSVTNKGLNEQDFVIQDQVEDVLEYATIFDAGGATLKHDTNSSAGSKGARLLVWPTVKIKPGETQERVFTIQLNNTIAATAAGHSNPTSYDCRIDNTFGNTVSIAVNCPTPKTVEKVVTQLPQTGPSGNLIFGGIVAAVVIFFYCRSRQLSKEVRLIRREITAGTL